MSIETELDPSGSYQLVFLGRKGMGKSENAARFYESYPYDRLALDITGDIAAGPLGHEPGVIVMRGDDVPSRFPEPHGGQERASVIYVPDVTSKTYREDLDRWVGLAFRKGRVLVWVDETHQIAEVHQTLPHTRRALMQGRHRHLVLLLCDPRAKELDSMVLHNADLVFVYRLPQRADRIRVAEVIGLDDDETATFLAEAANLPPYWFLRLDPAASRPADPEAPSDRIVLMPPVPFKVPLAKAALGAA